MQPHAAVSYVRRKATSLTHIRPPLCAQLLLAVKLAAPNCFLLVKVTSIANYPYTTEGRYLVQAVVK